MHSGTFTSNQIRTYLEMLLPGIWIDVCISIRTSCNLEKKSFMLQILLHCMNGNFKNSFFLFCLSSIEICRYKTVRIKLLVDEGLPFRRKKNKNNFCEIPPIFKAIKTFFYCFSILAQAPIPEQRACDRIVINQPVIE